MKFTKQHAGKWVATKDDKVIASGKKLAAVMKKVPKNNKEVRFALIPPAGFFAGVAYGI